MRRLGPGLVIMLTVGCASTQTPPPDAMRAACESDVGTDERCVSLLTQPQGGYESEAEVAAAEEARRAGAFQDRLSRLRAAHEARVAAQIQTKTPTVALEPGGLRDTPPPDEVDPTDELERELDLVAREDEVETGSSVRAMKAAPPPPSPVKVVRGPLPVPVRPPAFGPTPEQWLRAAGCVLAGDAAALEARLAALRKQGAGSRAAQGAIALLLVDARALEARVQAELSHRKLAKDGPVCSSSTLRGASRHLRQTLGEAPEATRDVERYAGGLAKAGETLEIRAGLPRAQ